MWKTLESSPTNAGTDTKRPVVSTCVWSHEPASSLDLGISRKSPRLCVGPSAYPRVMQETFSNNAQVDKVIK